ncbi:hypothetical protein ISN44_As06g030090 [Arabidopsis suecica]|uniref:Uncharacterized protein n=1 Tax=Arabidopsis suecica TaxID=45249 RepID=A0A8T2CH82_ARASU|nr:hypothetical protein ISN44_As06g030090 [Arabidopsis suecica]
MYMEFAKTGRCMLTIILLCLLVSSYSEAAQVTQITTPLEPKGGVINSPTKPQVNQNQPILGQPSSSSPVNQPLTGLSQPLTGFNQPSSTGLNQPILGQPSTSSSINQPLTGLNQPLTGFNQPSSTGLNQPILGQPSSSSSLNQPLTGFNQPSSTGFNQPISSSSSSSSAQNQPFTNRLNQNNLSGVPFLNGNSKLEVSITKIFFIWIGLFLALHGKDRN